MTLEARVLRDLHRAAFDAGRPQIAIPSVDLPDIAEHCDGRSVVDQALVRLTRNRRVVRVRRDLLVLPDARGLLGIDLVDLVDVVAGNPYLITAGRALERADLTDQHSFGIVVLTTRAQAPLRWRGQTATFHPTDPTNLWGWVPDLRPCYALPERTLLDVLNHPRYGVSLEQAIRALKLAVARDDRFLDRLHGAVERYGAGARNHGARATARRVGVLVHRLFGDQAAAPYRNLVGDNWAPVLLRPGGPTAGDLDREWRVVLNVTLDLEQAS